MCPISSEKAVVWRVFSTNVFIVLVLKLTALIFLLSLIVSLVHLHVPLLQASHFVCIHFRQTQS